MLNREPESPDPDGHILQTTAFLKAELGWAEPAVEESKCAINRVIEDADKTRWPKRTTLPLSGKERKHSL